MKIQAARFHFIFVILSIVLGVLCAYGTGIILEPRLFAQNRESIYSGEKSPVDKIAQVMSVEETLAEESELTLEPSPTAISSPSASPDTSPTTSASSRLKSSPTAKPAAAFRTLAVGSALPSGSECATKIVRSPWEPRFSNADENRTKGRTGASVDGASSAWNGTFAGRIDGNFTGTTDEILQWGACKWGFDVDGVRAVATQESWWRMSTVGDNGESHGILQVRNTYHKTAFPMAKESTAFNVDYALAWRRACYDGDFTWMKEKNSEYKSGDEWGCIGAWFSGNWYDGDVTKYWGGANWYIQEVKNHKSKKTWLQKDFKE